MSDESVEHVDNATPDASDDDIKRMDKDTVPQPGDTRPGESVDEGPGSDGPVGGGDPEDGHDPKAGAGNQQVSDPKESAGP